MLGELFATLLTCLVCAYKPAQIGLCGIYDMESHLTITPQQPLCLASITSMERWATRGKMPPWVGVRVQRQSRGEFFDFGLRVSRLSSDNECHVEVAGRPRS
jgi:hypothetical protein